MMGLTLVQKIQIQSDLMRLADRSISWDVYDAFFSYWRLSRTIQKEAVIALPKWNIHEKDGVMRVHVQWDVLKAYLEKSVDINAMEIAWAFALQVESALDDHLFPIMHSSSPVKLATDTISFTHSLTVRRVLPLLTMEHGEYYMSFLILITILERGLYDLYSSCHYGTVGSKKKTLILRDLLASDELQAMLPSGLLALMRIVLLPSGLNIRNLVWHGFMIPAEFPRCFSSLALALLLQLPQYYPANATATTATRLFSIHSFDNRFVLSPCLKQALETARWLEHLNISENLQIHSRRASLVKKAFSAMQQGDELWGLFALLPVLEHTLRIIFVQVNQPYISLNVSKAQRYEYYSTLDGFGQRDKHHVILLSDIVVDQISSSPNRLYSTLSYSTLATCLDLFMMVAGPNLRAKLCHGEADLSYLLSSTNTRVSIASQLLMLAYLSLTTSNSTDVMIRDKLVAEVLQVFERDAVSSFHPFYQLRYTMDACIERLTSFIDLSKAWQPIEIRDMERGNTDAECMRIIQFRLDVSLIIEATRLASFYPTRTSQMSMFGQLILELKDKLQVVNAQLESHVKTDHWMNHSLQFRDIKYLALNDADGLNVSACMLESLATITRSLETLECHFLKLAVLVRQGTARTNQRRSFLNLVFFLPVFAQLNQFCVSLVEHQLVLMRDIAIGNAGVRCVHRKQFEILQNKLLQFVTASEACIATARVEKASHLALQFIDSNTLKRAIANTI